MQILGIDPGLNGGFALVNSKYEVISRKVMPTIESTLDLQEIKSYLKELQALGINHAVLEKVSAMPGQGVVSMFKFGRVFGSLETMLVALDIPFTCIHPKSWTKLIHTGIEGDMHPKEKSLLAVKRLFPGVDFRATARSTKFHDGITDAVLLATWGVRTLAKI